MLTIDMTELSKRSLMLRRLYRAWRFHIRLNYSWRLAWNKALREKAPQMALNDAMLEMNALLRPRPVV